MPPFSGADFRLQSVNPIGVATLRVRYTQDPKLTAGSDGALNIANYTLTGPALNNITSANQISDDPQAIDLYLVAPLELGTWTLAIANVVGEGGAPLESPTSLAFTVSQTAAEEGVPKGAANDAVITVLRKHFNPALKGDNWESVMAAVAAGDQANWDNAKHAFNQLFVPSASGKYLDRRAGDQGVRRPPAIAMPDELFRDLAIVTKNRKLTQDALLEILEVFYGSEAVRATMSTDVKETFALEDTDDLQLLIDERDTINVVFRRLQFARIGEAKAVEVAASVSKQFLAAGTAAYATAYVDESGFNRVRIYSGRLGISSSVRVLGGKAQTILDFTSGGTAPDDIFIATGGAPFAIWDITASPDVAGNLRFTLDGSSATFNDLHKLVEGDRVLIYGQEFNTANRGTFEVKRVGVEYPGPTQWFEVENSAGIAQANVSQAAYKSLQFHRSVKRTIFSELRHAVVSQGAGTVNVTLPATTQAVRRAPKLAAYGNLPTPLTIHATDGITRGYNLTDGEHVIGKTTAAHSLAVGQILLIEGMFPRILSDVDVPIVAGTPAGTPP